MASAATTIPGAAWGDASGAAGERNAAAGAGRVPHTGDALLGLAAPAGIGLIAGQGLTWTVGETLTLASGQASHLAVAGNLRLHSGQAIGVLAAAVEGQTEANTLSLVTGEGELDIQAQNDQIKLQAKGQLKLVSANAEVEMAAGKTIHLATSGGASLTIEGGNIVIACPGTIKVHAAKKSFVGPVQQTYPLPVMPQSTPDETPRQFSFLLQDIPGPIGVPISNEPWKLVQLEHQQARPFDAKSWRGVLAEGVTDSSGEVRLSDAQSLDVWNAVLANPDKVHLIYGNDAVLIRRSAFAMSEGQKEIFDILEANNYIRESNNIPDAAQLSELVARVEHEFDAGLGATPKDWTKA